MQLLPPIAINIPNDLACGSIHISLYISCLPCPFFPAETIIILTGLCFMADAMEILLLSFLSVVLQSTWHLTEPQVEAIVSVVFVGAMVGTVVLSPLADRWGRQPIVTITATMIAVFGVATAFCASYPAILVARFLVGVGVGGLNVPYDALSEFMPSQCRGRNLLMVNIFWTGTFSFLMNARMNELAFVGHNT